jgi:hypothetical protein
MKLTRKKKSFFAHLRRIETTNYVMKRKSIKKWKKFVLRSFLAVLVKYERNHIYRMLRLNEIIYRVSSVIWIKKKREESLFVEILNEISTKRLIIKLIEFSTKKQAFESNSIIEFSTKRQFFESNSIVILIFSSQLSQSIIVVSFFSTFSTERVNTSSIESISSTSSTFSVLNRHFELRYRLDSFDLLNLLIMKCMKSVIDFQ